MNSRNGRTTTIILIVFVLIVLAGIGYYVASSSKSKSTSTTAVSPTASASATDQASPTIEASPSASASADVTADWKTYTNTKFSFSFKYPSDWILDTDPPAGPAAPLVSLTSPETDKANKVAPDPCEACGPDIDFEYPTTIKSNTWVKNSGYTGKLETIDDVIAANSNSMKKLGTTSLGGTTATEVQVGGLSVYYNLFTLKNDLLYNIDFRNRAKKESLTNTEKEILASFKFL